MAAMLRKRTLQPGHRCVAQVVFASLLAAALAGQRELKFVEPKPVAPIAQRLALAAEPAHTDKIDKIRSAWRQKKWEPAVAIADEMVEANKHDHRGYALKYLALLEIKQKRQEARQYAVRATRALAEHPLELVGFIEKALYSDPERQEYQIALMALVPVLPTAKRVARIRIAHLRAIDGCSTAKEAAAMSRMLVEDIGDDKEGLPFADQGLDILRTNLDTRDVAALALASAVGRMFRSTSSINPC